MKKEYIIAYICSNQRCSHIYKEKQESCTYCGTKEFKPIYDFYKILNTNTNSSIDSLSKNYKKLSMKYHPDLNNGNSDMFILVSEAYQVLKDKNKKYQYDILLNNAKNNYSNDQQSQNYNNTSNNYSEYYDDYSFNEKYYDDYFRDFNNFKNKTSNDIKKASATAGTIGAIIGLIIGLFFFGIGAIFGALIGYISGKANPFLGKFFLGILNLIIIFGSIIMIGLLIIGKGLTLPIILVWLIIVYLYNKKKSVWQNNLRGF